MSLTAEAIEAAERRIRPHVRETPLELAPYLEKTTGARVSLKLENFQVTGSFKIRGAVNKLALLGAERQHGVVAASSGNHGVAIAHAAQRLETQATVFVPRVASSAKIATMRALGTDVRIHGEDCVVAEAEARRYATSAGIPYISPYNDVDVAAGQGSIGVEIARQRERGRQGPLDTLVVSLGGGGLIAGIATYLKARWPKLEVVAVSPERSPAMHVCLERGAIVDVPCHDTLSDGTAGGVEPGAITFDLCREVIDSSVLVTEEEIRSAMRSFIEHRHQLLEGAAGVALAGVNKLGRELVGQQVGVVICGTNISLQTLRDVIQ